MNTMFQIRLRRSGLAAACTLGFVLHGQDKPLTITTTVTTGYYSTSTRGETSQSETFVPVGARFEMGGYYSSPELMSFSAQPQVNAGPQASDAGFQGGNGIKLSVTFLRKSITPLTFRYSNVQVEDVYFGGLAQLSGYSLRERNKDLGVTWELRPHGLPDTTLDWGTGSVASRSSIAPSSDYHSQGDHLNLDSKYEFAGWQLDGFLRRSRQSTDLLEPVGGGTQIGTLRETAVQYQGSAKRALPGDSEFYVDAGHQSMSSLLFDLPVDLGTRYMNSALRLRQRSRWKTMLRAGYSSNLASQLLERAVASLSSPGTVAPDGNVLMPFSRGLSNLNLNATTTYALGHGVGLYGNAERTAVFSSNQDGALDSSFFTTSAGITYAHKFRFASLSGEYAREFGAGSLIGQSGAIAGQRYVAGIQRGASGGLQMDLTVHGSDQNLHAEQPLSNRSFSAEGSVADRVAGGFSARLGGGWQWSSIVNAANEFHTNGFTARAGIEHPRVQAGATLNSSLSNSLPFYNQLLTGLGTGSILVTSMQVVPSDYRAMSFTLHANPIRKAEISASWTRSSQHLQGILNNQFAILNVFGTYHFRRIQLEAGFILSNQIFAFYPDTLRKRLYVRIVRSARLL